VYPFAECNGAKDIAFEIKRRTAGGRQVFLKYYWKNISYTTGCVSDRSVYPFAGCNGAKDTAFEIKRRTAGGRQVFLILLEKYIIYNRLR
jgi:hypothetical protein